VHPEPPALADGSPAMTADALLASLDALGLAHTTVDHAPVYTVEEARRLTGHLVGVHTKNLFLRNRKGRMWLVTLLADRAVDLRDLGARIGAGRVSFASERRLAEHLGLRPGSVTPFAVVNDRAGAVELWIDEAVLAGPTVWVHPLTCDRSTGIAPGDLLRWAEAIGREVHLLSFEEPVG